MKKVFVVNEPKGNRTALGKFGTVRQLCPGWIDNKNLDENIEHLIATLDKECMDGDYLVFGGHSKLNMVTFHWAMMKHDIVRQLFPNRERWYVQVHDGRNNSDGTPRKWWLPQ